MLWGESPMGWVMKERLSLPSLGLGSPLLARTPGKPMVGSPSTEAEGLHTAVLEWRVPEFLLSPDPTLADNWEGWLGSAPRPPPRAPVSLHRAFVKSLFPLLCVHLLWGRAQLCDWRWHSPFPAPLRSVNRCSRSPSPAYPPAPVRISYPGVLGAF